MYLLGIDVGTSGTKTVLFDSHGHQVASALEEYGLSQPNPGWAEQDPEDWWSAVVNTINKVMDDAQIPLEALKGIGISGQMHGLVMLDEKGSVLRPSIIWCDQRTQEQCDQIHEIVGKERLIDITGNTAITGFTAGKILWVKGEEPQCYEKVKHILLPKDYIRYRLTGVLATEVSDASGTGLLDIEKRDWSHELLDLLDIDPALLPRVYESAEITGNISQPASVQTGLLPGISVVGGAGDQAAGAIGNGIIKEGQIAITIGTSGVVFAHTDKPFKDPAGRIQTFCHAYPGAWHVMGVTQGAGLSLRWYRDAFCQEEQAKAKEIGCDPYEIMTQEASEATGFGDLIYLPYIMGERTPHLDPYAKGVFFGLTPSHGKGDMIRAIMEGVTYSLRECLDLIKTLDIDPDVIRVSGGGSKSSMWRQMQADIYECPVSTIAISEGPALGVAILAGVGTGVYASVEEACERLVAYDRAIEPRETSYMKYREAYGIYREIYGALKPLFKVHYDGILS